MKKETFENGILIESEEYFRFKTIEEYRNYLVDLVDNKTSESITGEGFQYDGETFSMSFNAQINWSNILNIPSQLFPLPVSTRDNEIYYLSEENKTAFYLSALAAKNSKLQAGNVKKQEIKDLTTLQECEDFEQTL